MKKNSYDALSTAAVLALVVCTFLAQHSANGYVFGVFAILAAAGSFAIYVKAMAKRGSAAERTSQLEQEQYLAADVLRGTQQEAMAAEIIRNSRGEYQDSLRRRRQILFFESTSSLKLSNYNRLVATQIKIHHQLAHDPALVIASVVERLCKSTAEPRFEFILSPDGTFRIRQIPVKRSSEEDTLKDSELQRKETVPEPVH